MQSVAKGKMNGSAALFIGIVAGFAFLIALFAGAGASTNVIGASIFVFAISVIAIGLILFSQKKK